jgi:hypothetical protein
MEALFPSFRMWLNLYHSTSCRFLQDTIVVEFIASLWVGGLFQINFIQNLMQAWPHDLQILIFIKNILSINTFSSYFITLYKICWLIQYRINKGNSNTHCSVPLESCVINFIPCRTLQLPWIFSLFLLFSCARVSCSAYLPLVLLCRDLPHTHITRHFLYL